jgi:outer membrane receptor protein involved in Fe transport
LLIPLPLLAQQQVIEEIIITATKRDQSLQDVPIAVSAFDGETLRRAGVRDIRDLQQLAPSLVLTSTQSETAGTTARIRGVGTTGDNLGLESAVAVFVDGVYRNRNSVALSDFGEVERIEVLRGPQGTLFGKNASAGLIHVITKGPDLSEFGGYAEGSVAEFDEYRIAGGVSGPIVQDALGFSLDANWTEREGFIDDVVNGDKYNDRDRFLVRGQLANVIGDNLEMRLIVDYGKRDETCCAAVTDVAGPTAAIINGQTPLTGFQPLGTIIAPANPFNRETSVNQDIGYTSNTTESGVSLEIDWTVGPGDLTSITSYRDWESERSQDLDYSDAEILYRPLGGYSNQFKTFTQELRYAWSMGDFDLLVGAYYVDEKLDVLDGIRTGADYETYVNALILASGEANTLTPGSFSDGQGAIRDDFTQDTDSWALFTHNTWNVTDRLGVTLGLRYTKENKDLEAVLVADNPACLAVAAGNPAGLGPTGQALTCNPLISPLVDAPNNALLGNIGNYQGSRSDEEWTGTFAVDYDFTDEWMGYASFARGYKAGGFNLDRGGLRLSPADGIFPSAEQLKFEPETVDSYELGAKGDLADGAVRLGISLFYAEYQEFQLNTFTGLNFIVDNLEKVESKGVEFEGTAFVADGLTLNAGITYNDAQYGSNISNTNLAGKQLTNAPEWVVTAAVNYERSLGASLLGFTRLDYRYTDERNTGSNLAPEKLQGATSVVNGNIGIAADDRAWEVELWARNLFDEDYRQVVFDAPLQNGSFNAFLADPRTVGLRARFNF